MANINRDGDTMMTPALIAFLQDVVESIVEFGEHGL